MRGVVARACGAMTRQPARPTARESVTRTKRNARPLEMVDGTAVQVIGRQGASNLPPFQGFGMGTVPGTAGTLPDFRQAQEGWGDSGGWPEAMLPGSGRPIPRGRDDSLRGCSAGVSVGFGS